MDLYHSTSSRQRNQDSAVLERNEKEIPEKKSKFKWSTDFWKALQQFYRKGKSLQQITMWQLDKHTEKSEAHNTHISISWERSKLNRANTIKALEETWDIIFATWSRQWFLGPQNYLAFIKMKFFCPWKKILKKIKTQAQRKYSLYVCVCVHTPMNLYPAYIGIYLPKLYRQDVWINIY